jgi:hypothetical protein
MRQLSQPAPDSRQPRWCRSTSAAVAIGGWIVVCAAGCGGRLTTDGGDGASLSDSPLISRLVSNDNGLAVRQWSVFDRPGLIGSTLAAHTASDPLDAETDRRLRRNGLRVVAVPADELDIIVEALGGAPMNVDAWYGQVYEWRELAGRPVPDGGQAIALDGHVQRYAGGEIRLMCRCWTVQMEDRPLMLLELIPQYWPPSGGGFARLLGQPAPEVEAFPSLVLDLELEPGLAYVVTTESPDIDWPRLPADDPEGVPARPRPSSRSGPGPGPGPAAAGPPTLGEWLLGAPRRPPTRDMLVLIPRIPPELWPEAGPDAAARVTNR